MFYCFYQYVYLFILIFIQFYFRCFLSWILSLWVGCCSATVALDGDLHHCFAVVERSLHFPAFVTVSVPFISCLVVVSTEYQDEEWQSFNGHLYYVSTTTADWQTSRDDCLSKGADLVVINDNEENVRQISNKNSSWIGLYKGDTWTWVDGSILSPSVSYWGPGEPNNVGNREDRAEIGKFGHIVNSWNDEPGSTRNYWICEAAYV
uniref:C-type lectin domain-containing protein n=1 Tax=Oryzias latipes TaxID=8090 RepID=A0A3P9LF84_ORYLA